MRIVFFGTSSFAAHILSYLLQHGHSVVAVVTRPDKPRGRSSQLAFSPVKEVVLKQAPSLPLFQPEKASSPASVAHIKSYAPDLFLVVAYGEIISQQLLDVPPKGAINIHASLLPEYRGAAPMQRSLMAGDRVTGVTIIEMVKQMDAGDMIDQAKIFVSDDMNLGELEIALRTLSCERLPNVLEAFRKGVVQKIPQDQTRVTLAPKIRAEEEKIDWHRPAHTVHNQIRALSPNPGAWCLVKIGEEIKRLKIKKTVVVAKQNVIPGKIVCFGKEGWVIGCQDQALRLLEVQLEGKKTMPTDLFIQGMHQHISIF